MDGLPFPTRRTSWFAGIVLAMIFYSLYYGVIFQPLLKSYSEYFDSSSFTESKDKLAVWVQVPRYYFNAGPSTIYIHVKNESDSVFQDVKIILLATSESETTLLLPNIYDANIYSSSVELPIVESHAIATGRISFITQSKTTITGILLQIGGEVPENLPAIPDIPLGKSSTKALQLEVLEHLLLPPWSNIFILVFVLFSIFLIHSEKEDSKEEPELFAPPGKFNPKWRDEFASDFRKSAYVLFFLVFTTSGVFFLLGFLDAYTLPPLTIIGLFTALIYTGWSSAANKNIRQIIVLLGFVFAGLGAFLVWRAPSIMLSPNGRIVWGLLSLEGLLAFFWFRRQIFSNPTSPSTDSDK